MSTLFCFFSFLTTKLFVCLDPKEQDKLELMKQTQMTSAQITVWFTNARVRLRKENKVVKPAKRNCDELTDDIIFLPNPSPPTRQFTIAYSNLYKDQIVSFRSQNNNILFLILCFCCRRIFIILH